MLRSPANRCSITLEEVRNSPKERWMIVDKTPDGRRVMVVAGAFSSIEHPQTCPELVQVTLSSDFGSIKYLTTDIGLEPYAICDRSLPAPTDPIAVAGGLDIGLMLDPTDPYVIWAEAFVIRLKDAPSALGHPQARIDELLKMFEDRSFAGETGNPIYLDCE